MLPIVLLAALAHTVTSQTWTSCNPLHGTCPADPALGGTTTIDFTKGASDAFTVGGGTPSYESDGIHLSVAQQGDAPTLTSKWYMMFGKIEVRMKAAPGQGIVSSLVLESDDLDEIDFEWIGGDATKVQSNYFGKGQTLTYDRGAYHNNPGNHDWHTYTVEFTANQIVWQVDGQTVRALSQSSAETNQYPQTPMQLKFGIWAGGAPGNSAGTIAWAGGPVNYAGGPYTMVVGSITATDYSTGTSYSYSDTSGNWQSIRSAGGTINGGGGSDTPAPSITQSTLPAPSTPSSSSPPPSSPSAPSSSAPPASSTPEQAPPPTTTVLPTTTAAPQPGSGSVTTVVYNAQGFATTLVVPQGWTKKYDQQGFLILPTGAAKRDVEATTRRRTNNPGNSVTTITLSSTISTDSSLTTSVTTITSTIGRSVSASSTSSSASTSLTTSLSTSIVSVSGTAVSTSVSTATTTSKPNAAVSLRGSDSLLGFGMGTIVSLLLSLGLGL